MPRITNQETINRHAIRIYGCSNVRALQLNDDLPLRLAGCKAMAYVTQRQAAKARGIGWSITFEEWISVWRESGKFDLRGVGKDAYCMSRIGDVGPYQVGNVVIKTNADNAIESLSHTPWSVRFDTAANNGKRAPDSKVCIRGHLRSPENISKHGQCRICESIRASKYRQNKKRHIGLSSLEMTE